MSFEEHCCTLFAELVADVVLKKPADPVQHMVEQLCFPVKTFGGLNFLDPLLCESCNKSSVRDVDVGVEDAERCCSYELRGPFGEVDCFANQMSSFLNSNETLLVIVGDARPPSSSSVCDHCGSGKSRLCRWLEFPGVLLHKRAILRVDSSNSAALFRVLESGNGSTLPRDRPTLTLVDHVEPPHSVLDALLQNQHFRSDRCLACRNCGVATLATLHKTIVFTRPGMMFKFPVACRVLSLVRTCKLAVAVKPQATTASVSFGALVGPANSKRRVRFEEKESEVTAVFLNNCSPFRERSSDANLDRSRKIFDELNKADGTFDNSQTFASALQSRSRVEFLLASLFLTLPDQLSIGLDLSIFPEMIRLMVNQERSDVYVAKHLKALCASSSRQLAANLLSLVIASQQSLSVFPLAVTATEMLELYLHTEIAESRTTDVLDTLNLQNIIIEAIEKPLRNVTMIAKTLLDVRGTTIDYEILNLLFRGTSLRPSMKLAMSSTSLASADFENQIERQISRLHSEPASDTRTYGHPVLLLSDVTDVGRHGFDGNARSGARVVNTPLLFCFIASLDAFGVPLILSLDKHQVVARTTFARADTEDDISDHFVWRVQLTNAKFIVDASMFEDRLLLLLADGSAACINMSEMKLGMSITLGDAATPQPPQGRSSPASPKFVAQVSKRILECHDPKVIALSEKWIAAASHDSDIVCVIHDPFSLSNERPIVMQTESNINCICLIGDLLIAGLETGCVQGFSLPSGGEAFAFEHHEAQINVIKSTDYIGSTAIFVVGSDDATITVFSTDDPDPIRSMRFHNDAVIDIVASHVQKSGVVISADRSGCVLVWTFDPNSPKAPSVVWSSVFPGLKAIWLSSDASWLVCTRTHNSPVALPIAEWAREGTGRFHQKCVTALHITNDEKILLTGGADGFIFVWDLNNSAQFLCTFQQHSLNSTINTISTSGDNTKVVSADATNLICLWRLHSGTIIRILQRSPGGGVARFIQHDFLLVQTSRGVKVFDEQERLFASTSQNIGCIDVFFASDEIFLECLTGDSKQLKETRRHDFSSSDSDDNDSINVESQPVADVKVDKLAISFNPAHERMRKQCFVGMTKGNADSGVHTVSIACLVDLDNTMFELARGDVEDEFGDEEELAHSDRITAFRFLQPRPEYKPTADCDESPPPPSLLLAATGAEDLTVILWNWCRQQPLKMLQHTNFVTSCLFWYPSLGVRSSYTVEDLKFLSTIDPSFRQCRDGAVVCNLITSQYSDTNKVSLRVFQVRENSRAFQRRLLMKRCGQNTTASNFPYNMLTVDEISTASIPIASGLPQSSVTCIAIRPSDGLLCTGDETCQVIFWRLSAIRTKKLIDVIREPAKESEYDDDDPILTSLGEGASVGLVPIRRLASRI